MSPCRGLLYNTFSPARKLMIALRPQVVSTRRGAAQRSTAQQAKRAWEGSMTCGFSRRTGKGSASSWAKLSSGERVPEVRTMDPT